MRTTPERLCLRAIVLVAVMGWTPEASANGPEVGFDAGTIFPVQSKEIQLVSEDVVLTLPASLDLEAGRARCVYVLRNLTKRNVSTTMAFVTDAPISDAPEAFHGAYLGAHFKVWQEERELAVRLAALRGDDWKEQFGTPQDSLPVWSLTFGPGETSRVRMEYEVEWTGGCDGVSCERMISYYTRPAALWAGSIDSARFLLRVADTSVVGRLRAHLGERNDGVEITPAGYSWTADGVEWRYRNWKPTEDLALRTGYDASDDAPLDQQLWAQCGRDAPPEETKSVGVAPRVAIVDTCIMRYYSRTREPDGWKSARVRVLVGVDGKVEDVRLLDCKTDGLPVPYSARRFVFVPARAQGKPVEAWTTITVPIHVTSGPD